MQEETIPENFVISTCPQCGTRLMCGKVIISGLLQCSRCKRHWLVEMDADKVLIKRVTHIRKLMEHK
ncbi:MAG: hypothetical protein LUD78_13255 [Clostridiales bacterium]|nr:hypothetical protein [Clostridiales bacterium]